jgi:hypothetical protein
MRQSDELLPMNGKHGKRLVPLQSPRKRFQSHLDRSALLRSQQTGQLSKWSFELAAEAISPAKTNLDIEPSEQLLHACRRLLPKPVARMPLRERQWESVG